MKNLPTDLAILNTIYNQHYQTFTNFTADESSRRTKVYIPIDIVELAKEMKIDEDIIFGRLYYHLEAKYGYKSDDGSHVYFFAIRIGQDRHCVNFPYLASVLADLREQDRKYRIATSIAVLSLLISITSIFLTLLL